MDHSRPTSASSDTHVYHAECNTTVPRHDPIRSPSRQIEPSLLEEKTREAVDDSEEAWAVDPVNARNWSFSRKWTAVGVVSWTILEMVACLTLGMSGFFLYFLSTVGQFHDGSWFAGGCRPVQHHQSDIDRIDTFDLLVDICFRGKSSFSTSEDLL